METALQEIRAERARQDAKWGADRRLDPRTWLAVLVEEVGEVARADLEADYDNYVVELVQVAAVAVAAIQSARLQMECR